MFEGFQAETIQLQETAIHFVKKGSGPPLLLLHGYPQSHVMWHKIAPKLAEKYTVIVSDLRGYGDSGKPETDERHSPYSKRKMAADQVELMERLGFSSFLLASHDRGSRVSHRLVLDHPGKVEKLIVMDIAPTYSMYKTTDMEFAQAYYHWFFLIQPYDLPEKMIGADPVWFLKKKFGQWGRDTGAFTEEALNEYLRCLTPETIHASCEDYRASANIDLEHDQIDLDKGNKIDCPMLCLWGEKGFVGQKYDVVAEWEKWADDVQGFGIPCGHYLPEEAAEETLKAILDFFS
ncbi:MAG: alpha/beta hydrolase [Bacteroidia bacterium]|nr:alpha/beta hydrolase [Bacteroidia bacterium]